MSNENPTVSFNELTLAEQAVVSQAKGWDGKTYFDAKSCIKIELVDGDVASYRVLDKGDQVEAETVAEAPVETAPEAPVEVQATEPAPSNETSESQATATEPTPTEPSSEVTPADTTATEPEATA